MILRDPYNYYPRYIKMNMNEHEFKFYNKLLKRYIHQKTMFIRLGITSGERFFEICSICTRLAETLRMGNELFNVYCRKQVLSNMSYMSKLNDPFVL